jgi:glycosyltransferase involved in cell wall biosynthesis
MMRICLIGEAISPNTQRMATGIANEGCEVHLISENQVDIEGVISHRIPIYSPHPIEHLGFLHNFVKKVKYINPDVYHLFGLFPLLSLKNVFLAKIMQNLVVTLRGSDIVQPLRPDTYKEKLLKKYLLNSSKRIIAVSKYLAGEAKKYLNKPRRIEVIPGWFNVRNLRPVERTNNTGTITIGFAKRLHSLSGPDILLKAYHYASTRCKKKLKLRIAGAGPLEVELKKEVTKLGIDDSVECLGWLSSPEDMQKFFRSLDVFIMPSRKESLGISAIEASVTGLPVIASNFGGIPEIVTNNETGRLVNREDITGFGKAIIELAEHDALRVAMGLRAAKMVEENFSNGTNFRKIVDIYYEIAESN